MTIAPLLAPVPIYARGENFTTTPPSLTLWTLRTNDMDDNEKVKKSNRFNKQNNNFAQAPHFFVNFLSVFARLRHENALFRVYGGRNFISLSELGYKNGHLKFSFGRVRLHLTK